MARIPHIVVLCIYGACLTQCQTQGGSDGADGTGGAKLPQELYSDEMTTGPSVNLSNLNPGDITSSELTRNKPVTSIRDADDHLSQFGVDAALQASVKDKTLLRISGQSAREAFDAMKIPPNMETKDFERSADRKLVQGLIGVACIKEPIRHGSGGSQQPQLGPPGVDQEPQAEKSPFHSTCDFRIARPEGSRKQPQPPFLKLTGQTATNFWQALEIPSQWEPFAGWHQKVYSSTRPQVFWCEKWTGEGSEENLGNSPLESGAYQCQWEAVLRHQSEHESDLETLRKGFVREKSRQNGRPNVPTAF